MISSLPNFSKNNSQGKGDENMNFVTQKEFELFMINLNDMLQTHFDKIMGTLERLDNERLMTHNALLRIESTLERHDKELEQMRHTLSFLLDEQLKTHSAIDALREQVNS